MTIHWHIRKPNKDRDWWICEIGVRRYKLTHITFWYFTFLFWVLCIETREKGW